jgi:hypothetical protein
MRMPAKLGTAGKALWRDITGTYDLNPGEQHVLAQACREADLIDRIQSTLDDGEVVVKGSHGQPRISTLVAEIRQHRSVFRGLIMALNLPDVEDSAAQARKWHARKAARTRWSKEQAG